MNSKGRAFFVLVILSLVFSGNTTAQKDSKIDLAEEKNAANEANSSWEFDHPDLAALPPSDLRLVRKKEKVELRFSTAFWNTGDVPFELVGGAVKRLSRDEDVEMKQRLLLRDGSFLDLTVGPAHWHAVHNHYHLEDIALYTLESIDGNGEIRTVSKTGYCMRDDLQKDKQLKAAAKKQIYRLCGTTKQGLSVGWMDIYYWNYDGQSLDVTSLPPGNYRFILSVDPDKKLIEKTRANNVASVNVFLDPQKLKVKILK